MADGSIFDLEEFKPYKKRFENKAKELNHRRAYYDGDQYRSLLSRLKWLQYRVGKEVRPLFMPLARAVDIDAGIIPGGWLLPGETDENSGSDVLAKVEARDRVFAWSNWQTKGVLYVHYGAQYGVSATKVSDLREKGRITITPVDPLNLLLIGPEPGEDDPIMSLWVETKVDSNGDEYEFAEVILPDIIRFFRSGRPYAPPGYEEENINTLEKVPYCEVRHIENGEIYGECTYKKAMLLLDELNNLATDLANSVEKHGSKPQWGVFGAEPSDLRHDEDSIWFFPVDAKAEILIPRIDFQGVLEFIREIKEGVKESLPELSFDELRSKDQIAAETLGLQLIELVLKVLRTRPNYDTGLVRQLRLAGEAAADMGLSDIAVLNDEMLILDPDRPVLPLDERTKIDLEMAHIALEQMRRGEISEGMDA